MPEYSAHKKTLLSEFVYLRLILIITLVLYHALSPFTGAWEPYHGMADNPAYLWIGDYACYLILPAFMFMSGYLFGYSTMKKKSPLTFHNTVGKKFKRLFIPSLIFSIIYAFLFYDVSMPVMQFGYKIINGSGHLWFLPALFWCFVITYILSLTKIRPETALIVSLIIGAFPIPTLILRLDQALTLFVYFYIGYELGGGYLCRLRSYLGKKSNLPVMALIYLLSVFLAVWAQTNRHDLEHLLNQSTGLGNVICHVIIFTSISVCQLLARSSGIGLIYSTSLNYLARRYRLTARMTKLSGYCFGVYIYQQFFLILIYYRTPMPHHIASDILPWIAFALTLAASILLTWLTLKTKVGRYLIG